MLKAISILFLSSAMLVTTAFGQSLVQITDKYVAAPASMTIALSFAATTAGDLIIVHLDWDKSALVSSVKDNAGNTYTQIGSTIPWNGNAWETGLWYAYNIKGGSTTITAKFSKKPTVYYQMYIAEYKGIAGSIDPLDQEAAAAGSTTAVSSGTAATKYNNELVFGISIGSNQVLSAGTAFGFAQEDNDNQNMVEDEKATSIGNYAAKFTSNSAHNWVAQMATFISTMSVLPVDFESFTGKCNGKQVELDWTTASETNSDYFAIGQSNDGSTWNAVGTVKAAGNSSIPQNYRYTEASPGQAAYFRLRQVDLDGHLSYSGIITVNGCAPAISAITLYPNPITGTVLNGRMDLPANESYNIEVVDNLGRVIYRSANLQAQFTVNFSHSLTPGIYYARIASETNSTVTAFLVK